VCLTSQPSLFPRYKPVVFGFFIPTIECINIFNFGGCTFGHQVAIFGCNLQWLKDIRFKKAFKKGFQNWFFFKNENPTEKFYYFRLPVLIYNGSQNRVISVEVLV
jgi:hypothetical protein